MFFLWCRRRPAGWRSRIVAHRRMGSRVGWNPRQTAWSANPPRQRLAVFGRSGHCSCFLQCRLERASAFDRSERQTPGERRGGPFRSHSLSVRATDSGGHGGSCAVPGFLARWPKPRVCGLVERASARRSERLVRPPHASRGAASGIEIHDPAIFAPVPVRIPMREPRRARPATRGCQATSTDRGTGRQEKAPR